jgi:hypothetical protein
MNEELSEKGEEERTRVYHRDAWSKTSCFFIVDLRSKKTKRSNDVVGSGIRSREGG